MATETKHWKGTKGAYVLIGAVLATALCYLPSLQNDWVNWDDPAYVLSNPLVTSDTIQWKAIFQEDQVLGIYHPITLISYAIDYQLWGEDAYGYHLTNLLFHLLNTALVFLIFRRLKSSLLVAGSVALLFGIHPLHVESVAWISERKDVLYVFFLLLAWLSYLRYASLEGMKQWTPYALVLIFFCLSILSKPIAFVFPIILLLSDYLTNGTFRWASLKDKIPIFLIAFLGAYLAHWGQSDSESISFSSAHPVPTFFYGSYNLTYYLIKSVIPVHLCAFHPFPTDTSLNTLLYLSALPFLGYVYLLYWSSRRYPRLFFGLLFFALTIAPLLQILPFGKALSSERYTYLPYLGLFYVAGISIEYWWKNGRYRQFSVVVIGIWGLVFMALSWHQQTTWKNSESLWTSAIEKHPEAYFPYLSRGRYYAENEQPQRAWKDFNRSIEARGNAEAYYERGLMLEKKGDYQGALNDYLTSLKSERIYPKSHLNAAQIYWRFGERSKCLHHIQGAIKADPEYSLAHFNLAIFRKSEGKPNEALTSINRAVSLEPNNMRYLEMRAAIYTDLGEHKKAVEDFLVVLKAQPENGIAHYYTALNYQALGNRISAKKHLQKAIQHNYAVPQQVRDSYQLE